MDHQNVLAAQTRPVRGAPGVGMNGTVHVAGEMEYNSVCNSIHAFIQIYVMHGTCTDFT